MLYASYATGYKSGGFNQLRTEGQTDDPSALAFGPEESASGELGLRSTWLNRMITFNITGYFTKYSDFQAQVFDGFGIRVINAGSFQTYGFESDITLVPFPGWITVFTAGLTKTIYTDFEEGPCQQDDAVATPIGCTQDLTGRPLDNTPLWNLGLFTSYERALPVALPLLQGDNAEINWFVMMDYNYQSSRYLNASLDPALKVDPTSILGFRAGLRHPDTRWEVNAWIKNVTDEDYWAIGFDVPTMGGYAGFQAAPRTFGGTIRVKF
jgi:iron complex outermembrane receptor protein